MAVTTANMQKMKSAASELENIYTAMTNNQKKLEEAMTALPKIWFGEGAQTFQKQYQQNAPYFGQMAAAIQGASQTLNNISTTYDKADAAASEAIRAKLGR
jgi:WXG100 family type VII secretion target